MSTTNQLSRRRFEGMPQDFQQHYDQLIDTVNSLAGHNGPIVLQNHLDLNGNQVKNLGTATDSGDAVSSATADATYSAAALRPKLEATGTNPLRTTRRIADQNQREPYSSFLNKTLSTPPNTNGATVSFVSASGHSTTITVTANNFQFADGTVMPLPSRSDTVSNPGLVSILSISRAGTTVTVMTAAPHGLVGGEVASISGVSDSSFNGSYTVTGVSNPTTFTYKQNLPDGGTANPATITSVNRAGNVVTVVLHTPLNLTVADSVTVAGVTDASFDGTFAIATVVSSTSFTYAQTGANGASTGGTAYDPTAVAGGVSLGGVYYYYVQTEKKTLSIAGPFAGDTSQNRFSVSMDGNQFVAVAVVTASGGNPIASGGGATVNPGDAQVIGCTEVGTYLQVPDGSTALLYIEPCNDWVELRLDGHSVRVARGTLVSVFRRAEDLVLGDLVEGQNGSHSPLREKFEDDKMSYKQCLAVSPAHTYLGNGVRLHNAKISGG